MFFFYTTARVTPYRVIQSTRVTRVISSDRVFIFCTGQEHYLAPSLTYMCLRSREQEGDLYLCICIYVLVYLRNCIFVFWYLAPSLTYMCRRSRKQGGAPSFQSFSHCNQI